MTYSVALIGCGWVARNCYLPAITSTGGRIAGVFDSCEAAAIDFCTAAGIAAPARTINHLVDAQPDLVVVASPPFARVENCTSLAHSEARVLCEKPFARTALEARRIGQLLENTPTFVSTPFSFRPDVGSVLRSVKSKEVGEVKRVRLSWRRRRGVPQPGSWRTSKSLAGGGALMDLGPHMLDLGLRLLGPGKVVDCIAWKDETASRAIQSASWMGADQSNPSEQIDVETGAGAIYKFDDQKLLQIETIWSGPEPHDTTEIEIEGENGRLRLSTLFGYSPDGPAQSQILFLGDERVSHNNTVLQQDPANDFAYLLTTALKQEPAIGDLSSVREGILVADLIDQAYQKMERP